MLKPLGRLLDVTALWLWVQDYKPVCRCLRRGDERYVQNRISLASVAHNMHFAVSLKETLACLDDALVAVLVIFSYGTRVDRNQSDTWMMVPASRSSGFDYNLCKCEVCRSALAFHFDALVLSFELAQSSSGQWGGGHALRRGSKRCSHNYGQEG